MVDVIGTKFRGRGQYGDFVWMLEQDEYLDSLFVFNDCELHFLANASSDAQVADPRLAFELGGGNAAIRPYQKIGRALGIPTGCFTKVGTENKGGQEIPRIARRGYTALTPQVKTITLTAIMQIAIAVQLNGFKRVFYSADDNGIIGTSIFNVDPEVCWWITHHLKNIDSFINIVLEGN